MLLIGEGKDMNIESFKNAEEIILWKGKPNKSVFIKEQIFSPLLILALIWLAIDAGFILGFFGVNEIGMEAGFLIPFFILHLLPVWIYLGRVIFAFKKWKNIEYMVTDSAVYAITGIFTTTCERKTFQEVTNVSVHQGIIDKRNNVGDVFIITGFTTNSNGKTIQKGINIVDIEDYMKVYRLINKTGTDIYSDTMYPNDLRPKDNHGYRTNYVSDDENKKE